MGSTSCDETWKVVRNRSASFNCYVDLQLLTRSTFVKRLNLKHKIMLLVYILLFMVPHLFMFNFICTYLSEGSKFNTF